MNCVVGLYFVDKQRHVALQRSKRLKRELVNAPADSPVKQLVFFGGKHNQVFGSIVESVRVAMMNVFITAKSATKNAFHHQSVFCYALSVDGVNSIAISNGAFSVGASPVFGIEDDFGVPVSGANNVHIAHRPELAHKAAALTRRLIATRHFTRLRQRYTAWSANLRIAGKNFIGQFKRAPKAESALMFSAQRGPSVTFSVASINLAHSLFHVAILNHKGLWVCR